MELPLQEQELQELKVELELLLQQELQLLLQELEELQVEL